jgi:hypothetical protein
MNFAPDNAVHAAQVESPCDQQRHTIGFYQNQRTFHFFLL